jgi:hypothetical protein
LAAVKALNGWPENPWLIMAQGSPDMETLVWVCAGLELMDVVEEMADEAVVEAAEAETED